MKYFLKKDQKIKQPKGITLIALAVTIAVIIILVGITIKTALGDNSIVEEAKVTKASQEKEIIKSQVESIVNTWEVEATLNDNILVSDLWKKLKKANIIQEDPTEKPGEEGTYILKTKAGDIEITLDINQNTQEEITTDTTAPTVLGLTITGLGENYIKVAFKVQDEASGTGIKKIEYRMTNVDSEGTLIGTPSSWTNIAIPANANKYSIDIEQQMSFLENEYPDYYKIEIRATDESDNVGEASITQYIYCFVAGTQVLTENGLKAIETIQKGEKVWTLNTENNLRELKEVNNTITSHTNTIYEITVSGEVIKATGRHEFYVVDKGWIRAYDLEEGDRLVSKDKNPKITNINIVTYVEPIEVYNLSIQDNHNYLITQAEVLVHNSSAQQDDNNDNNNDNNNDFDDNDVFDNNINDDPFGW